MKSLSVLLLSLLFFSPLSAVSPSEPPVSLFLRDPPLTFLRLLHRRDSLPFSFSSSSSSFSPGEHEAFRDRRDGSPLSIDLTFHLLRNMIHMARAESQREQALLNRKVLEEIGK